MAECGYDALVMWTGVVDDGVIELQAERMRPGDIILLHYRDGWREDLTAAYLAATAAGLSFAPPRGLPARHPLSDGRGGPG